MGHQTLLFSMAEKDVEFLEVVIKYGIQEQKRREKHVHITYHYDEITFKTGIEHCIAPGCRGIMVEGERYDVNRVEEIV